MQIDGKVKPVNVCVVYDILQGYPIHMNLAIPASPSRGSAGKPELIQEKEKIISRLTTENSKLAEVRKSRLT